MKMIITKPTQIIDPLSQLRSIAMLIVTFLCIQSNAQVNLDSGLVAYYPFNGDAYDYSGNGNHGNVNGATLTNDRFGHPYKAFDFNGVNNYIQINPSSSIETWEIKNAISISAWINIRGWYQNWNCFNILSKYNSLNDYGMEYQVAPIFSPTIYLQTSKSEGIGTYWVPSFNTWYHVAVCYSKSNGVISFFINGLLLQSVPYYGSFERTNGNFYIGYSPAGPDEFSNGIIDEIRVYNRALSYEEIENIYTNDTISNHTPIANAGSNQTINEKTLCILDGTGSWDADGDPLTYKWSAPTGISLSSSTAIKPTFTAPSVSKDTSLLFSLVVNDGHTSSTPNQVQINVKNVNQIPVAVAGDPATVVEGNLTTLNGSASYDPDGENLTYSWTAPTGITLNSATISNPSFTAPQVNLDTIFRFVLIVNDGITSSLPDTVEITVQNHPIPKTLILQDSIMPLGSVNCFGATDTIYVAGNSTTVTLENGSNTTLIAGKLIRILPGFHAKEGSNLDAHITLDGIFCEEAIPIVSIEGQQKLKSTKEIKITPVSPEISPNLIVYPNPTSGQVTIETSLNEHNSSVYIYNSLGACIWNRHWVNSNKLTVEIPGKQGIYIIRIIQNNQQESRKIIVE